MTTKTPQLITRCITCGKVVRTQDWHIWTQEDLGYCDPLCFDKDVDKINANAKARKK